MKKKFMLAGIVTVAIVNTATASILKEMPSIDKKTQAMAITNIFGGVSPAINSPECTVRPY